MRRGLAGKMVLVLFSGIWTFGPLAQPSEAAEPAARFLQALRDAGYHDMATEYLQRMRTSPLAPIEWKETLDYELGTTLIEASRAQRDLPLREKQLDEARDALKRFIGQHPEHTLVSAANNELGNLLVERARIKVEQSKQAGADKKTLMSEAGEIYTSAYNVFARAQVELKERLAGMGVVPPEDDKKTQLQNQLRADYLQVQLLAAAIKEESADTQQPGSAEYKKMLQEAGDQYGQIYEKYRTRLAGLYARMYQGRCKKKLGQHKEALSYFGELLEQPDNPEAFRTIKLKTMLLAAESWAASSPPLYAEAASKLGPFVDGARPNEQKSDDWLTLRLAAAKAQWGRADELLAKNSRDVEGKRLDSDATKNAKFVAAQPGDLQQEARQLLADRGAKISVATESEPKTFDEAKQAGRDALEAMQTAELVLKTVPQRVAKEQDADEKKRLEEQLAEATATAQSAVDEAKRYFHMALKLADEETDVRDVNIVRYFLCFLYYKTADYYDAGLIGEFIARRYPDSSGARQSAKIALASYVQLYSESEDDDKSFEIDQIVGIANYIAQQWSDQPEAVEALNTLISFMIQAGDLDMAEKYLNDIPADSDKRGDAEIKTGQAMWSEYLKQMQQVRRWEAGKEEPPAGLDLDGKKAELESLKGRAEQILVDGVNRIQQTGGINELSMTAALSLAQLYVDTDQAPKAIKLLEDEKMGPLTLVTAKHAATSKEGFDAEVYKTALRAYVSSLTSASDQAAVIKKATAVMDAMKAAVDQDSLIKIYVSLARDLESQMKLASPQAKQALSKGFETFLDRLRNTSTDVTVLNWVAETFSSIGEGLDVGGPLNDEAKRYLGEAAATYEAMLEKGNFSDDKLKTQVQLRLAMLKCRLAKFTDAKALFVDMLTANNMMLNVQVEAAKMYQQWATYPGSEALYQKAISGAEPDPADPKKNIIWGWGKMFMLTAKYTQFRQVFHQARYNLAFCRYQLGKTQSSSSEQNELYEKAKQDVLRTQQLYGSGPEWEDARPKYDALLKDIQRSLGESATGLPEDPGASTAAN